MQPSIATTATSPEVDIVRTIERLENALLESISELKRMKRSISEMSQHFAIGKQIRQQPNSANGSTATSVYDRAIVETLQEINHRVTFKRLERDTMVDFLKGFDDGPIVDRSGCRAIRRIGLLADLLADGEVLAHFGDAALHAFQFRNAL